MRICDGVSDVCSSDLLRHAGSRAAREHFCKRWRAQNLVPFPLPLGPSLGAIRTRAQHLLSRPVETFSAPGAADAMAVSPEPPEAFERGRLFAGVQLVLLPKIGRSTARESICQYVSISVVP